MKTRKVRVDVLLTERGLAPSRAKAQALVMAGQVRVNGQVIVKPATRVDAEAPIQVERGPQYVSRGGKKLAAALDAWPLPVAGRICADVGASTGGFTDCLLQRGAARVYAIDVGKGILHWKLRNDPRVVVMEGVNARYLEALPEAVSLVVADVSFISLKILLPVIARWGPQDVAALIKPQFEAGRRVVARGKGVVRDPEVHRSVLLDVLTFSQAQGFAVRGLVRSPIRGPKGNTEFLVWLAAGASPRPAEALDALVGEVLPDEMESGK